MFFLISLVIRMVAVLGGIGGGMMFTSLMMGFTGVDSYIIRATGLLIATSGSVVAARRFLARGLANIRLVLFTGVSYSGFAVIGALTAGYVKQNVGEVGEAAIRVSLGTIVLVVATVMLIGGGGSQYPDVKNVDGLSRKLHLAMAYWEQSLGKVVDYRVSRASVAVLVFCMAGFLSGLFGIGAGWIMVPTFNLIMLVPLKVAAASSSVLMGVGDTAAVWQYIKGGAIFPLFAVPCLSGSILGALIGSRIMLRVKASFVRGIIIAIMYGAGFKLVLNGVVRFIHL
jgi:uncharacterized membrane protein YfcA